MGEITDAPALFDLPTDAPVTTAALTAMRGAEAATVALHRAASSYASDAFRLRTGRHEDWAFFYNQVAIELRKVADGLEDS